DEMFDRAAGEGDAPDPAAPARERLFDIVMRRFEAMEEARAGVLALEAAIDRDPSAQAASFARAGRTARWLLALAGEAHDGVTLAARAQALAIALGQAKAAWRQDEGGDFSRTMAALDRALRRNDGFFDQIARVAAAFMPKAAKPRTAET